MTSSVGVTVAIYEGGSQCNGGEYLGLGKRKGSGMSKALAGLSSIAPTDDEVRRIILDVYKEVWTLIHGSSLKNLPTVGS